MSSRALKWWVWGLAILAYVVAVMERTSMGVSMAEATSRFHAPASIVATFTVVQLVVYAGMQVPCGLALDRYGSRVMLTTGSFVMAAGQVWLALAGGIGEAIGARVLVGLGDAMIFGAAVRLVPAWFEARHVPFLTQMTGLLGQFGQILSAVPLVMLLRGSGWSVTFLVAGVAAALAGAAAFAGVRNTPAGSVPAVAARVPRRANLAEELAAVWRVPGTRLGMWTHLATGFAPMVFAMTWGFPYLTQGEGLSDGEASGLLTLFVVGSCFFGPVLGLLTQRHPLRRSNLALVIVALNALPWLAVLCWDGPAPRWLLVTLVLGLSSGGPGSAIGFDFARTFNPERRLGTATGLVIVGAFGGALVCIFLAGLVLDAFSPATGPDLVSFRWAMAVQMPLFVLGTGALLVARRKTRARMAASGVLVPPWREALRREFAGAWWWRRVDGGAATAPEREPARRS